MVALRFALNGLGSVVSIIQLISAYLIKAEQNFDKQQANNALRPSTAKTWEKTVELIGKHIMSRSTFYQALYVIAVVYLGFIVFT